MADPKGKMLQSRVEPQPHAEACQGAWDQLVSTGAGGKQTHERNGAGKGGMGPIRDQGGKA